MWLREKGVRLMSLGSHSQQVQSIRIDLVENLYAAPSRGRSRSRGRSSDTAGTTAPARPTAGAPLPSAPLVLPTARSKARPFNVLVPWCAELTRASLRRARRAALVAAGGVPRARRGRRGGRSQQVQLIRIDQVENFDAAPSRSRSRCRGRSSGLVASMAPMRTIVGAPLPSAPLVLPKARSKARPFHAVPCFAAQS